MKSKEKTCIDLFAGAGGLTEGLRQSGFTSIFANEISPAYSETLKRNHSDSEIETADIRSLDANQIRKRLNIASGELDILAGGPPCQGFSVNAPTRSTDDERNHLFLDFLKFVEAFSPKVVLIENVPGMLSFEKGKTVASILNSLKQLGYDATVKILYAAHYGVPQMRWRTIFIANRIDVDPTDMYPVPTHFAMGRANFSTKHLGHSIIVDAKKLDYLPKNVTVTQAISDLPVIENGGGDDVMSYTKNAQTKFQKSLRGNSQTLYNHKSAGLGKANLDRLPHIPPGGSWRDIPYDLLPEGMKRARRSDHTKRYGRLDPNGIGSTILTKCDPHWGTYIHYEQDRIISVREAARIQSFPDKFRFYGSLTEQYEQVGNAVPPALAAEIGRSIFAYLDNDSAIEENKHIWHVPQMPLSLNERILVEDTA